MEYEEWAEGRGQRAKGKVSGVLGSGSKLHLPKLDSRTSYDSHLLPGSVGFIQLMMFLRAFTCWRSAAPPLNTAGAHKLCGCEEQGEL